MVKVKKKKKAISEDIERSAPKRRGFSGLNPVDKGMKYVKTQDVVDLLELTPTFQLIRFVGDVYSEMSYWIDIDTPNGVKSIPKRALSYDPETDTIDSSIEDPYADLPNPKVARKYYYANAIIRDLQDDEPRKKGEMTASEKKTGFKEKGSKAWTPVRVVRLTPSLPRKLMELREINVHRIEGKKQAFDIIDPVYGCDIYISCNKSASPSDMYSLNKGEASKLTKEEKKYLIYDVSKIHSCEPLEVARKEAEQLGLKCPDVDSSEDEDDEDDLPKKKKLKEKVSKKKSKSLDDEPVKKKKKKKKK